MWLFFYLNICSYIPGAWTTEQLICASRIFHITFELCVVTTTSNCDSSITWTTAAMRGLTCYTWFLTPNSSSNILFNKVLEWLLLKISGFKNVIFHKLVKKRCKKIYPNWELNFDILNNEQKFVQGIILEGHIFHLRQRDSTYGAILRCENGQRP